MVTLATLAVGAAIVLVILRWVLVPQRDVIETHETFLRIALALILGLFIAIGACAFGLYLILVLRAWRIALIYGSLPLLAIVAYLRISRHFRRKYDLEPLPCGEEFREIQSLTRAVGLRLGLAEPPVIMLSGRLGWPLVFGTWRDVFLALPRDFLPRLRTVSEKTGMNQKDLGEFVLTHELSHIKHKDYRVLCWGFSFVDLLTKIWLPVFVTIVLLAPILKLVPGLWPSNPTFRASTLLLILTLAPLVTFYFLLLSANRERELLADARVATIWSESKIARLTRERALTESVTATPLEYLLANFSMGQLSSPSLALSGHADSYVRSVFSRHPSDAARLHSLRTGEHVNHARLSPSISLSIWLGMCLSFFLIAEGAVGAISWPTVNRVLNKAFMLQPFAIALFFFAPISNSLRVIPSVRRLLLNTAARYLAVFATSSAFFVCLGVLMSRLDFQVMVALPLFIVLMSFSVTSFLFIVAAPLRPMFDAMEEHERCSLIPKFALMFLPCLGPLILAAKLGVMYLLVAFTGTIVTRTLVKRLDYFCLRRYFNITSMGSLVRIDVLGRQFTARFRGADVLSCCLVGCYLGVLLAVFAAIATLFPMPTVGPSLLHSPKGVILIAILLGVLVLAMYLAVKAPANTQFQVTARYIWRILCLAELVGLTRNETSRSVADSLLRSEFSKAGSLTRMEEKGPYLMCLSRLNSCLPYKEIKWIQDRASDGGGFGPWPGATPSLHDTARAIAILTASTITIGQSHADWIMKECWIDGMFKDVSDPKPTLHATFIALETLDALGKADLVDARKCSSQVLQTWRTSSKTDTRTYHAVESLHILRVLGEPELAEFANWTLGMYADISVLRVDQNAEKVFHFAAILSRLSQYGAVPSTVEEEFKARIAREIETLTERWGKQHAGAGSIQ